VASGVVPPGLVHNPCVAIASTIALQFMGSLDLPSTWTAASIWLSFFARAGAAFFVLVTVLFVLLFRVVMFRSFGRRFLWQGGQSTRCTTQEPWVGRQIKRGRAEFRQASFRNKQSGGANEVADQIAWYNRRRGGFPPASRAMCDVTRILGKIEAGDPTAAEQLLPLVYEELRKLAAAKMAQEKPDQTLQATALVHEAYIRLVDVEQAQHWNSRGHFYSAAAEAMRRILVEHARQKRALKREGHRERLPLDELAAAAPDIDLIALDGALDELAARHPQKARLVMLRYFGGCSLEEAAQLLGISRATAQRHWTYARTWLFRRMAGG
jgi:RNA polymerase sigma factor (TIGR02999 family)